MMIKKNPDDIRCSSCNKLLMKGYVFSVEIKCPRCGKVQQIARTSKNRPPAGNRRQVVQAVDIKCLKCGYIQV